MAGFGFSVGDFMFGVQLCSDIIKNCAGGVGGALNSYQEFKSAVDGLQAGLLNLVSAIEERRKAADTDEFRHPNDEATCKALEVITTDIRVTLGTIRKRLKQYPIHDRSGFGRKMVFWIGPRGEIKELIDRCQYHIATINFILGPFKEKIMTDIHQFLIFIKASVENIRLEVEMIRGDVQALRELMQDFFETAETPHRLAGRRRSDMASTPEIDNPDSLDHRFLEQLREDKQRPDIELKNIPLSELTRSVVWWLEKGQMNTEIIPPTSSLTTIQYINLRKSAWMTHGFTDHPELRSLELNDKDSLWHSYCEKLRKEVDKAFDTIKLQIPSPDAINSLDSHYFSSLVEFEELELDNTLESPGEELILNLELPDAHYQTQFTKFMAFRQGSTGHLRCVEVIRTRNGMKETIKEYTISRSEWLLRPFYMEQSEGNCWNMGLYSPLEMKTFSFSSTNELLDFQHAFTGGHVRYANSYFKKIEYNESKINRSARKFTSGMLQLWFEKPHSRLNVEGNTPSTGCSSSTIRQSTISSLVPSIASFATTVTEHRQSETITVLCEKPVEISRVFAFTMDEKGKKAFITFTLGDHIYFDNTSCCNNYRYINYSKKGKPEKRAPLQVEELCCPRLVIETIKDRKTFSAQVLESMNNDDHFGMALDERRLPEGSRSIELAWFAISFKSKEDKLNFIEEYQRLETIRKIKVKENIEFVKTLKRRERTGRYPEPEGSQQSVKDLRKSVIIDAD